MIVDIHTHVGEYPGHISETFAEQARAAWADVVLGGTLDEHHANALDGVDRAVVLAFDAPAAGFVVPNDYVASYVARDPARLLGFGSVDPSSPTALDELERMKSDLGLVGCKLGPIYQNVDPLGPEFLRVCEALERLELPMLIHQGTTFARSGSLSLARPILLDEIALRYPELRIVIAHMGHPWFDETIAVIRRHPHVYADVSALVSPPLAALPGARRDARVRRRPQAPVRNGLPVLHRPPDDRRPALGDGRGVRAGDAGDRPGGDRGHHRAGLAGAARHRLRRSLLRPLGLLDRLDLLGLPGQVLLEPLDPGSLGRRHGVPLDHLCDDRRRLLDVRVADRARCVTKRMRRRVALEHAEARGIEQRDQLAPARARAAHVGEHDVRLDRLGPERMPGTRPAAAPSSRARRWSSAIRSTIVSSATRPAAAAIPARCTLPPPRRCSHQPRPLDDGLAARQHRAERRREALVEREARPSSRARRGRRAEHRARRPR